MPTTPRRERSVRSRNHVHDPPTGGEAAPTLDPLGVGLMALLLLAAGVLVARRLF